MERGYRKHTIKLTEDAFGSKGHKRVAEETAEESLTPEQEKLASDLKHSTLAPGFLKPSAQMRMIVHAAVLAGEEVVCVLGPADDRESERQARDLSKSPQFARMLQVLGIDGDITCSKVVGKDLPWQDSHAAIFRKRSGEVVESTSGLADNADVMAIMFGKASKDEAAVLMSTRARIVKIIDPSAPAHLLSP